MQSSYGPRCPNHGVELVDCHNGIGICPVSTARFSYSADDKDKKEALRLNVFGQIEKTTNWTIKHIDGDDI